jgi:hypothetical protein
MLPIAFNIAAELLGKVAASRHASDAVQNSQRTAGQHRSTGVFGSALERQSLAQQAHTGAAAIAMHRDDLSESHRNSARSMLMRPVNSSKA